MRRLLYSLFFVFTFLTFYSQDTISIDSIEKRLQFVKEDTTKIILFSQLSKMYTNPTQASLYAKLAYDLSKDNPYYQFKAIANNAMYDASLKNNEYLIASEYCKKEFDLYNDHKDLNNAAICADNLGNVYLKTHQYDQALIYFSKSRDLYQKLNNELNVASEISKIANLKKSAAQYGQALSDYYNALRIFEEEGASNEIAQTLNSIVIIQELLQNYEKSKEYYNKSLELAIDINDSSIIADTYNNLGNILRIEKEFDQAEKYYYLAIAFRKKNSYDEERKVSYSYNNLGLIFHEKQEYLTAIDFYLKAIEIKFKIKDWASLTSTYTNIAETYIDLNDFQKAMEYLDKAETISKEYNKTALSEVYRMLSKAYEKQQIFDQALKFTHKAEHIDDSLEIIKQEEVVMLLTAQFDHESQKNEIDILEKKNKQLLNQKKELNESENKYVSLNRLMIILIFALIIAVIVAYRKAIFAKTTANQLEMTNDELRKTLISKEEKEMLIKEIHHRVKNNLQIIKSLVRLQQATSENEEANEILREFEQRVSSMALVHEELYKSSDLTQVKVKHYLTELVSNLIYTYAIKEVDTDINIEIKTFGIDTLVPVGLLVNEIIANSLKHGIKDRNNGKVTCYIKPINDQKFELFIGDNGEGFPENFNFDNPSTLGIELIQTLVEQLNGTIEIINDDGAYYRIIFENLDKNE